jgi:hypothetical protein
MSVAKIIFGAVGVLGASFTLYAKRTVVAEEQPSVKTPSLKSFDQRGFAFTWGAVSSLFGNQPATGVPTKVRCFVWPIPVQVIFSFVSVYLVRTKRDPFNTFKRLMRVIENDRCPTARSSRRRSDITMLRTSTVLGDCTQWVRMERLQSCMTVPSNRYEKRKVGPLPIQFIPSTLTSLGVFAH